MDCREAKKKLTGLADGLLTAEDEKVLREHLKECPSCARLALAEQLLTHDIEQMRAANPLRPMTIDQVREGIAARERNLKNTNPGVRIMRQVTDTIYRSPRLSLSLATVFVLLLASIVVPVRTDRPAGYEIAFATPGPGLILNQENAERMLAALEIDDASVEVSEADSGVEYIIAPLKDTAKVRKLTALLDSLGGQRVRSGLSQTKSRDWTIWQLLLDDKVLKTGVSSEGIHVGGSSRSTTINLKEKFKDDFVLWMSVGKIANDSLTGILMERQGEKTNIQIVGKHLNMSSLDNCGWNKNLINSSLNTRTPDGDREIFNMCDLDDVRRLEKMGYNFATMEFDTPGQVPIPGMGPKLSEIKPDLANGQTTIEYMIPQACEVQLQILDEQGTLIHNLLRSEPCACMPLAGIHQVVWDGFDADGDPVRPGTYVCRFIAGDYTASQPFDLSR